MIVPSTPPAGGTLPDHDQALTAVDEFSALAKERMPGWLVSADNELKPKVIQALLNHHRDEAVLATRIKAITSPVAFARPLLIKALTALRLTGFDVDRNVLVRIKRLSLNPLGDAIKDPVQFLLPRSLIPIVNTTHMTLLEAALQNVSSAELSDELGGEAFILERSDSQARSPLDPLQFANLCRSLNLGEQYQRYLKTVFPAVEATGADLLPGSIAREFIAHEKSRLAWLSYKAYLNNAISRAGHTLLQQWLGGEAQLRWGAREVRVCSLSLLSIKLDSGSYGPCPLYGALLFIGKARAGETELPCMVYMPHDKERPLFEYPSLEHFNKQLALRLRETGPRMALKKTVELRYQSALMTQLQRALRFKGLTTSGVPVNEWHSAPQLNIALRDTGEPPWFALYRQYSTLTLNNARALVVPTDHEAAESFAQRVASLFESGQPVFNLAAFFVPGLGEMLMLATAVQLLSELYTGVEDWSHGEINEAIAHFGSVAQNLLVMGVGARASSAWASLKPPLNHPALLNKMAPVLEANGDKKLFKVDLTPYRSKVMIDPHLEPDAQGIYRVDERQYVHIQGHAYEVRFDVGKQRWQVQHPFRADTYTPTLEHNEHGAWQLAQERPAEWNTAQALHRAWPYKYPLSEAKIEQISRIVSPHERALRWSHVQRERPPGLVFDTLKRFKLAEETEQLIARLQAPQTVRWEDSPDILHLMLKLPGWPAGRGVQLLDAEGKVLSYVSLNGRSAQDLRIVSADLARDGLFKTIASLIPQADATALLGAAAVTPEQRTTALTERVASFAKTQKQALFNLRYARSEHFSDGLMATIHQQYPSLPTRVVSEVIERASVSEIKSFEALRKVPLRLAEELRLYAHEVKTARALEGCFLDVADPTLSLKLITAFFAQTERGRHYLDKDPVLYRRRTDPTLTALQAQHALGLMKGDRGLRNDFAQHVHNHPEQTRTALGLQPVKPWFKSPMRLANGRLGYPLSGERGTARTGLLVRRVQDLYPTYTREQCLELVSALETRKVWPEAELARLQLEREALDDVLRTWCSVPLPEHSVAARRDVLPGTIKRAVSHAIRRAWRRESYVEEGSGGMPGYLEAGRLSPADLPDMRGYMLDLSGMPAGDLPKLVGDFSHISVLVMDDMALTSVPEQFLQSFPQVRWLSMQHNQLKSVPLALTEMKRLQKLDLSHNAIELTAEGVKSLAERVNIKELDLSDNPLGLPLDVSGLEQLRYLNLRRTHATEWPVGVETVLTLRSLDLRDNAIGVIPDAALSSPSHLGEVTYLHGNPLVPTSQERLDLYVRRTGISMGDTSARVPHSVTDQPRHAWLLSGVDDSAARRTAIWKNLEQDPFAEDLRGFLGGLRDSPEYVNERTRAAFAKRACAVLQALGESNELRETLLARIRIGSTSAESSALTFSDFELLTSVAQAKAAAGQSGNEHALLRLARSVFRLDQVEGWAQHLQNERLAYRFLDGMGAQDVVQLQDLRLVLRIALAKHLQLPAQPSAEAFESLPSVPASGLESIRRAVLRDEASGSQLLDFIASRDFWVTFLKSKYRDRFTQVRNTYISQCDQLEFGERALSEELFQSSQEVIRSAHNAAQRELLKELTRQEMADHPF